MKEEKDFKSTTRWENGAELIIERFPAPDLIEASARAAQAGKVLWPSVAMVYLSVEEASAPSSGEREEGGT